MKWYHLETFSEVTLELSDIKLKLLSDITLQLSDLTLNL